MRMGGNTGIERVVLSLMLLGFSGMAFAQAEPKPVPAPSVAPSFPPAANRGPCQRPMMQNLPRLPGRRP